MNKTITTIALSVAFLSSAAMANNVHVDTGLQGTLALLTQHAKNGSALNLAINTNNIDATVNIDGRYNSLNNVGDKVSVELTYSKVTSVLLLRVHSVKLLTLTKMHGMRWKDGIMKSHLNSKVLSVQHLIPAIMINSLKL